MGFREIGTFMVVVSLVFAAHAAAAEKKSDAVVVNPNQVVVQVNGIVCSFCARGAEKSLTRLLGLNKTVFGDGVLVDINTHRITIALKPGELVPVRSIYDRIKKGGYDPITMHFRLKGRVKKGGDSVYIFMADTKQSFVLMGDKVAKLVGVESVDIQVRLDALKISTLGADKAFNVVLEKVLPQRKEHE